MMFLEYIVDYIADTDIYMNTRPNYDIFMIVIFIFLGCDFLIGSWDSQKDKDLPKYLDEIIKILIAVGIGICGKLAYKETNSDNKKLVADYYFKMGAGKILPHYIELIISWTIKKKAGDNIAEVVKSILKCFLWVVSIAKKNAHFEPLGGVYHFLWVLTSLVYGLTRALFGSVGKIGGKIYKILLIIAGASVGGIILCTIFATPSH